MLYVQGMELTTNQAETLAHIAQHPGCTLNQSQKNSAQPLIRLGLIRRVTVLPRSTYEVAR
jgi:hypothetical protein